MAYLELGIDPDQWACPREFTGAATVCQGLDAETKALFKRLQRTLNRFSPITRITLATDGKLSAEDFIAAARLVPEHVGPESSDVQSGIFVLAGKAEELEPALAARADELRLAAATWAPPTKPKGNGVDPKLLLLGGLVVVGVVLFGKRRT